MARVPWRRASTAAPQHDDDIRALLSSSVVQLSDGSGAMPVMGVGTLGLSRPDAEGVVYAALEVGYRHIDCAPTHGNQVEVGRAVRRAVADGIVRRDELFISSKLWATDHRPEHVRPAAEHAAAELGVEYLDLFSVHMPFALRHTPLPAEPGGRRVWEPPAPERLPGEEGEGPLLALDRVPLAHTWAAVAGLRESGLVRSAGVCNFSAEQTAAVAAAASATPAVNQVEMHPWLPQARLLAGTEGLLGGGVRLCAHTPLGRRGASSPAVPCDLLRHPAVRGVAEAVGATPAQVLLQWSLARGAAVVPRTRSAARLRENAGALAVRLGSRETRRLAGLGHRPSRMVNPATMREERGERFFPPDSVEAQSTVDPARGNAAARRPHSFHWTADVALPPRGDGYGAFVEGLRSDLVLVLGGVDSLFVSPKPNARGCVHGHVSFRTADAARMAFGRAQTERLSVQNARLHVSESRHGGVSRSHAAAVLGGLPAGTEAGDVRAALAPFGAVRDVDVYEDPASVAGERLAVARLRDSVSYRRVLDSADRDPIEINGVRPRVAVEDVPAPDYGGRGAALRGRRRQRPQPADGEAVSVKWSR